jgi:transcriptional regulator with XRE-family HTH domain
MSLDLVQKRISLAIKARKHQGGLSVRTAARQCSVDASTLSRLERGVYSTLPDAGTLEKLARWLGTSVGELLGGTVSNAAGGTLPDVVEVHLRADKNLSPKTAKALADMFKALYEHATKPAK